MSRNANAPSRAASAATASTNPEVNWTAVDKACDALKSYDYGSSRAALMPIDDAVVACLGDAKSRKKLEKRLATLLQTQIPPLAKEFLCRKLLLIGSADSVPALRALLADKNLSHWARTALELIPSPKAVKALRESLPRLSGLQKTGVVVSLGMRRDPKSVSALAALLKQPDLRMAGAAAEALGNIGTVRAAKALLEFRQHSPDAVRPIVADACLACAERLASANNKARAITIYEALASSPQPEQVRLAARRGLSKVTGKK
jgi:HEAT repeat protein